VRRTDEDMKELHPPKGMASPVNLVAQVLRAGPDHEVDEAGGLRPRRGRGAGDVIYLGDVATTLLHGLRQAATITVVERPRFDEQRWVLDVRAGDLHLVVRSRPYWGFGLVGHGYLNELTFEGDADAADRLVFDLCAALGRDPWVLRHGGAGRRALMRCGLDEASHEAAWKDAVRRGRDGLRGEIRALNDRHEDVVQRLHAWLDGAEHDARATEMQHHLMQVEEDLALARRALSEDHAPGVERALARAEAALIQADPVHLQSLEADAEGTSMLSLQDDLDVVDLT